MYKINSGSFGTIYKVSNIAPTPYIIKNVSFYNGTAPNLLEIILYLTTCSYLIKAFEYKICDSYYSLSMPIALCDLSKIQCKKIKLNIKDIITQISLGVKFLHDRKIIHGDIKPSNILLFKNGNKIESKLSDFSLSRFCLDSRIDNTNVYTMGYKAPEIQKGSYDFKADIWALGQTFKIFYRYTNDEKLKELINNMTLENENLRWNIDQVLSSNYLFQKIENDKLDINFNTLKTSIMKSVSNEIITHYILNKMCGKINFTDLLMSKQEVINFDTLSEHVLHVLKT